MQHGACSFFSGVAGFAECFAVVVIVIVAGGGGGDCSGGGGHDGGAGDVLVISGACV